MRIEPRRLEEDIGGDSFGCITIKEQTASVFRRNPGMTVTVYDINAQRTWLVVEARQ
jgi:hypothetical protein